LQSNIINKSRNNISSISKEDIKSLISASYGSGWLRLHPDSLGNIPEAKDLFSKISPNTLGGQYNAGIGWEATNWNGVCDELAKIA
jgi:hypothetical protein